MAVADTFVSVVAPLRNDGDIVEAFVQDITATMAAQFANYEIILVDDGSEDDTVERLLRVFHGHDYLRLIRLSRRFGEEVAISAGLDSVIGDYVVVMRAESDPPAMIPEMVDQARRGGGVVLGLRQGQDKHSLLMRLGAGFFYWYCNRVLRLNLPKMSEHFLVMSREAVNGVFQIRDRLRHLRVFTAYVGYSSQEFPYQPIARRARHARRGFLEALDLGIKIIVANSTQPLRLVSAAGLSLSLLNALYLAYVLATSFLANDTAAGWATQSVQTSAMFLFLFLILTVLCEYVGRILSESQDRPLYYTREEINSNPMLMDEERRNVTTHSTDS